MDADADADAALPHAVSHDGETTFKCVTWQERGNRKGIPDGWALDHLGPMVRMVAVISCDYKKIWSSLHIQHIYIYIRMSISHLLLHLALSMFACPALIVSVTTFVVANQVKFSLPTDSDHVTFS